MDEEPQNPPAQTPPFKDNPKCLAWGPAPEITPASTSGCSLHDAAWRYANDQQAARKFLDLNWRSRIVNDSPELLTLLELESLFDLQNKLVANLVARLLAGELVAFRRRPGETALTPVEADWWEEARIDLRLNQVQLGETVITRIQIREAVAVSAEAPPPIPAEAPPPIPKPAPKVAYSAPALAAWFLLRVGTWPEGKPPPNRLADRTAALEYFDKVPPDEFRRIRKAKTSETWRKRGPRGPR